MNFIITPKFKNAEKNIQYILDNFSVSGKNFDDRQRNQIKLFDFEGKTINVKSFKKPNFINKIAYKFFRKSKARRSFEYANILLEKGIGTPQPIAFQENYDFIGLTSSYYVSEHLDVDLTYREISQDFTYPDTENILKQFVAFCYKLHQNGIEFLDHSPGNTLIKKTSENQYDFFLVDLNRMRFHEKMDFETRMKNLSRLTPQKEIVAYMAKEYAQISGENQDKVFERMWFYTDTFQNKFHRKKRLKKKLKFWKNK